MLAGHIGVAFALGRVEPRVKIGVLVVAALWLDLLLWALILLGRESVRIPADYAATHQPAFVFPYSHGLAAALAWSAVAGGLALGIFSRLGGAKWRAAAIVAAAVFSHWLLDWLVHRPELPLAGGGSALAGLALWNHMPAALAVEAGIVALGMVLFFPGSGLPRGRAVALAVLSLVVLAFTIVGMTLAPPPPSGIAMAQGSLATLVLICVLFAWLGRPPRARPA